MAFVDTLYQTGLKFNKKGIYILNRRKHNLMKVTKMISSKT